MTVSLCTDSSNFFTLYPPGQPEISDVDQFEHFSIDCGTDGKDTTKAYHWAANLGGSPDWAEINYLEFTVLAPVGSYWNVDGLHFGGFPICRVAYNSDYTPYCMKLIVDDVGKDDSLNTADDSGMMAQLAYAELLRSQKTTYQITTKQQILPDALPGQWFSISSVDLRAREITHVINGDDFTTYLDLTSDVVNGNTRRRYEDINKQYAALRPENQDRQATNIKAGKVDWRTPRYEVDYSA
jgi:hypothetical protein